MEIFELLKEIYKNKDSYTKKDKNQGIIKYKAYKKRKDG